MNYARSVLLNCLPAMARAFPCTFATQRAEARTREPTTREVDLNTKRSVIEIDAEPFTVTATTATEEGYQQPTRFATGVNIHAMRTVAHETARRPVHTFGPPAVISLFGRCTGAIRCV